jgi:chromosome segregation ATPase
MDTITTADYVQYGFMAFMSLLLVAIIIGMWRQSRDIGEMKAELRGVNRRIDELAERVGRLAEGVGRLEERVGRLEERVGRLEETVASLAREIGETKGLLLALHERVNLVMRHRHEPESGQVILTPEEVAAD